MTKPVPLRGIVLDEDREVARRVVETGERERQQCCNSNALPSAPLLGK